MPARRTVHCGFRPRCLAAALAAVALLVTSCTNTSAPAAKGARTGTGVATTVAGVQQITVVTGPDFRFHPSTLVVHQGKVRIVLINKTPPSGGPPHNLQVSGLPGAFLPLVGDNQTGMVTFTAPSPGRYGFVCTIHTRQGQTGTLVVKAGTS